MPAKPRKPLTMETREVGGKLVVRLAGTAGMEESEPMRLKMEELASRQSPVMVLDMTELDFVCSLSLGAIISGHLKSRHHGGLIRVANPNPTVRDLLETTRLTKIFPIYPTVEAALAD